jgi:hypothetical protein
MTLGPSIHSPDGRKIESTLSTFETSAMPRSDERATDWSVATWEGAERK